MTPPLLAVVGHPNKGKSSLVATLAYDDRVAISPAPGTTTWAEQYPMRVDGTLLYTLIDTPGFQRPRKLLAELQEANPPTSERGSFLESFLANPKVKTTFPDEVALLTPILEGAGILYVVDSSVPFSSEYEAEMEILRWTGQPRLAIINPITSSQYTGEWQRALDQYFSIVRVLNAQTATLTQRVELLRALGALSESWQEPLDRAVAALQDDACIKRKSAARKIVQMLVDMLALRVTRDLSPEDPVSSERVRLQEKLQQSLQKAEQRCRDEIERLYGHSSVERREEEITLLSEELFSETSLRVFGLNIKDLMTLGVVGGAAAGGVIDVAVGGASFLMGSAIGAGVGAVAAYLGSAQLMSLEVLSLPLGRKRITASLAHNSALLHSLLGRARFHRMLVAAYTHSRRGPLDLSHPDRVVRPLEQGVLLRVERLFRGIQRGGASAEMEEELVEVLSAVFVRDDGESG